MLIAIDGSTVATGYAFGGADGGVPRGGVWELPGADEMVFDRTLDMVGQSLFALAGFIKAEWVFIEAPLYVIDRNHSAASAAALIQLTGAIRAAAYRAGCKIALSSVKSVRKHFIGTGNLPSRDAKLAVQKRCRSLGWAFKDDNHADALALWAYGMATKYPKWAPQTGPLFAGKADSA